MIIHCISSMQAKQFYVFKTAESRAKIWPVKSPLPHPLVALAVVRSKGGDFVVVYSLLVVAPIVLGVAFVSGFCWWCTCRSLCPF